MSNVDIFCLNMYTAAIQAVITKPRKFTDGIKCSIWGDKHTFNKCSIINDIPYLSKYFIAYRLQWKRTQKQMTTVTAVNKIQAAAIADGNNDHEIVSDNSNTTIDDDDDDNNE